MLRVFKNLENYKEEGKLAGWIKVIVINCCIDFCKKKNIFKTTLNYTAAEEITIEPDVFDRVSAKEVQQVISILPAASATVFRLFIYEGFTHRQISTQLKISEGTSKWLVSEAKKLLKKKFEEKFEKKFTTNATI